MTVDASTGPTVSGAGVTTPALVPFLRFTALWIQVTGTWCNLSCSHCLNASGPRDPWLAPLSTGAVERYLADAERLGVKEIYFTGGEPFLHRDIERLLARSLAVAPTTVLTNGTAITAARAARLADIARAAAYSLEIRVSIDDTDAARNDLVRGRGAHARAVAALRQLDAHGLLPIVTATEILQRDDRRPATHDRFREFLRGLGIARPRVKILSVLPVGRMAEGAGPGLSADMLDDPAAAARLPCADGRAVTATGVYACPILAGLDEARLASESLEASFRPARPAHGACVTCWETGTRCTNS